MKTIQNISCQVRVFTILHLLVLIILIATPASAQFTPEVLWWNTYCEGDASGGNCVRETDDGGFILAGIDNPIGTPYNDAMLTKTDSFGNEIWSHTYGYGGTERFYSVAQTDDGGYIAVGYTNSFAAYTSYVYLVKTDSEGDTLWTRTYNSEIGSRGDDIKQTQDGGYIVAGSLGWYEGTDPEWRILLLKYDSSGNLEWDRVFDDWNAYAKSIVELEEGGYVFTGQECSVLFYNELLLMKVDDTGELVWSHFYSGPHSVGGRCVQQAFDGDLVVAGFIRNGSSYQMYLLRTNPEGDTLWTRDYGGPEEEGANSVVQTYDGGYALTGDTESYGSGGKDIYVVRTDSCGDTLWTGVYGGSENDEGYCIQQTTDSGFIITGSYDDVETDEYAVLIRLGRDGVPVDERAISAPMEFQLYPAYPNPFNAATTLSFDLLSSRQVSLKIFDITGREAASLVTGHLSLGKHEFVWDAEGCASGVYLVRLTVAGMTDRNVCPTRKLILLK